MFPWDLRAQWGLWTLIDSQSVRSTSNTTWGLPLALEVGGSLVGQSTQPMGFDAFSQHQDLMESGPQPVSGCRTDCFLADGERSPHLWCPKCAVRMWWEKLNFVFCFSTQTTVPCAFSWDSCTWGCSKSSFVAHFITGLELNKVVNYFNCSLGNKLSKTGLFPFSFPFSLPVQGVERRARGCCHRSCWAASSSTCPWLCSSVEMTTAWKWQMMYKDYDENSLDLMDPLRGSWGPLHPQGPTDHTLRTAAWMQAISSRSVKDRADFRINCSFSSLPDCTGFVSKYKNRVFIM